MESLTATMYAAGFRPRTTGCIAFGDLLPGRRPRTRVTFLSRQESTQRNAPLARRRLRRCSRLGAGLSRCSEGTSLVPTGARATYCAPLSLLSLASPGLAVRGEPVQRDKRPLDLRLRTRLGLLEGAKKTNCSPFTRCASDRQGGRKLEQCREQLPERNYNLTIQRIVQALSVAVLTDS